MCDLHGGERATSFEVSLSPHSRGFFNGLASNIAAPRICSQVEVFKLLVEKHGARLDTVTANESGLLHVACEAGAFDVAKLLLEDYG